MKIRKKMKTAIYVSTTMWAVLAGSFLLMKPAVENTSSFRSHLVMSLGIVFWFSLLLGIVFQVKASIHYHRICKKEKLRHRGLPGMFRFFSNPVAIVADVALIISLFAGWMLLKNPTEELYVYLIVLFLLTLSMSMHCIWNGKMVRMLRSGKKGRIDK